MTRGRPGSEQAAAVTSASATAHTSHSAWVTIRSGRSRSRVGRSRVYNARSVCNRSRTRASMSRLLASCGMSVRVTFGRPATNAGKSHSWVTPTRSLPSPSWHTISVALGSRDTIRIPNLR